MHYKLNVIVGAAAALLAGSVYAQDLVVKIGHVGPTSGQIAHLGKDNENGARMAIDELNAKGVTIGGKKAKFELLAEDDAADPKQGTAAAQKLVDAKVNGVVGHLNSGTSIPASKIYSDAGIPQISPSATNPKYTRQGYKTTFRVVADDVHLGGTLGKYAVTQLKGKSIAVIDDRTAYGQGVADEFEKGVKAAGGKTVKPRVHQRQGNRLHRHPDQHQGQEARRGLLRRHGRRGRPDDAPDEAAGHRSQVHGRRRHLLERAAQAGRRHDGRRPGRLRRSRRCRRRSQEVDGRLLRHLQEEVQRPTCKVYAPYVYDAVNVMVAAMVKAGSADPAKYLPVLAEDRRYKGVTGTIAFDNKGDIKNGALTLYTYKGGKREQIAVVR